MHADIDHIRVIIEVFAKHRRKQMWTVAKLICPPLGLGQAKLKLTKSFHRIKPSARMSMLTQAMKQMRAEYDRAETEHRIERQHEDARNAETIQARA